MKTANRRRPKAKKEREISLPFLNRTKKQKKPAHPARTSPQAPARLSPQAPASFLILSLLAVAICTAAFVYHLHIRFEGVWLGYETSKARAERARLVVERRELRLELASLKSPGEVESEAREKLGMDMPDHKRIIPLGKPLKAVLASGRAR